jgi:NAD+ kinase
MGERLRIGIEGRDAQSVRYARNVLKKYDIELSSNPEMILTIGGDGAVYFKKSNKPILPIRISDRIKSGDSSLGFLADHTSDELEDVCSMLQDRRFQVKEYFMLGLYLNRRHLTNAVNDVYANTKDPRKAMRFDVLSDGCRLFEAERLLGDGVIVATAFGSSGYNESAGGWLVNPGNDEFVVTLNNPIGISKKKQRSMIVGSDAVLKIEIYRPEKVWLCSDGLDLYTAKKSDNIVVRKSKDNFKLVKIPSMEESWEEKLERRKRWLKGR